MINRRNFLKTSAAFTVLGMLPGGLSSCGTAVKSKKIGMQIYSVAELLKVDFDKTIAQLVEVGIKRFESFRYGNDGLFFGKKPAEMKAFMESLGAGMTSSHAGVPYFRVNEGDHQKEWDLWKKNCAETAEVGSGWIIRASYPTRQMATIEEVKYLAEHFNKCGEIAKTFGLQYGFHNHSDELKELEGQIPYEVLLNNTDKDLVAFQLDTCHVCKVYGADVTDLIRKYPGRFSLFHISTETAEGENTTLDKGMIDFKTVFELADVAGMKEYYIEQPDATIESMKVNHDFLMNAPYVKF